MKKALTVVAVFLMGAMLAGTAAATPMTLKGRAGGSGPGNWEFSLAPGGQSSPVRIRDWTWQNGVPYAFALGYASSTGMATFTIWDGETPYSIATDLGTDRRLTSLDFGLKANHGSTGTVGLEDLTVAGGNGAPQGLSSLQAVDGESLTSTSSFALAGDWSLSGLAELSWLEGTDPPSGSQLDFRIIAETALDQGIDPPLDPPGDNGNAAPVPEPGTILLLGLGLGGLAAFRKTFGMA